MGRKEAQVKARITKKALENFKKYGELYGLKSQTEIIEHTYSHLFDEEHQIGMSEQFLTFQKCKFYSENPSKPEYIKCRKDGYWKTIKRKDCQACALHREIKVPLKRREKLEEENSQLKNQKEELITDISKLKEEYQAVNVSDLQAKLKSALEVIQEKNMEIASLQTDNEQLRVEMEQISKVQMQPKTVEKPQYIERTVEKVVEKVVYKPHPLENMQILCSSGKGYVSLTEECMKNCKDILICPYYSSIAVENKIPENAKLKFVDSNMPA